MKGKCFDGKFELSLGQVFGRPGLDSRAVVVVEEDAIEFVEPFVERGDFEALLSGEQADLWDFGGAGALFVAGNGCGDRGFEIVSNDFEVGGFGEGDVLGAVSAAGVGVVDDDALLSLEANLEEAAFTMARLEHVAIEAEVGGGEALMIKRGLA